MSKQEELIVDARNDSPTPSTPPSHTTEPIIDDVETNLSSEKSHLLLEKIQFGCLAGNMFLIGFVFWAAIYRGVDNTKVERRDHRFVIRKGREHRGIT